MNSTTLTINSNTVRSANKPNAKPITATQIRRALANKWDLYAVIGLIASCAAYGVYALAYCGMA